MSSKNSAGFFFNPFKSKVLLLSIGLHFLFIMCFQAFFGKTFFLAPDERGYLQVAKDIYSPDYNYVQWGWPWRSPVWFLQIIYTPFKIMLEIGIPELISFRLNAVIYTSIAIYLLLAVFYWNKSPLKSTWIQKFALLSLFLPTFFLWGSIGLRECFLYLSFTLIGAGITLLETPRRRIGLFLLTLGSILLAYTKDYVYLIFLVTILVLLVFQIISKRMSIKLGAYYVCAIIAPIVLTPAITFSLQAQVNQLVFGNEVPRANLSGNSTGGEYGAWGTERGLVENCNETPLSWILVKLVKPSEKIEGSDSCKGSSVEFSTQNNTKSGDISEETRELLTGDEVGWNSSRAAKLSLEPAHITEPLKLIAQLAKVIALPLPFIDNGSSILNILSFESLIWMVLISLVYVVIFLNLIYRKKIGMLCLWCSTFISGLLVSSALTEINVGTMIRHRSLVLILCFFVIANTDFSKFQGLRFQEFKSQTIRRVN